MISQVGEEEWGSQTFLPRSNTLNDVVWQEVSEKNHIDRHNTSFTYMCVLLLLKHTVLE